MSDQQLRKIVPPSFRKTQPSRQPRKQRQQVQSDDQQSLQSATSSFLQRINNMIDADGNVLPKYIQQVNQYIQENKRLKKLAKQTQLRKTMDDLNIKPDSAEKLMNIFSGLNRSPQTGPVLKKQNSVSSLSSGGVQDKKLKNNTSVQNFSLNKYDQQIGDQDQMRGDYEIGEIDNSRRSTSRYKRSYSIRQDQQKSRKKTKMTPEEQFSLKLGTSSSVKGILPKIINNEKKTSTKKDKIQTSTTNKSSLKKSPRHTDLINLQHQNSGHKKSQSRQTSINTSSNISDPVDGFNQRNLLVDPAQEIQKIFSEIQKQKQRKQG